MIFTKDTIAALKLSSDKTEEFKWDDEMPGFGVRLRGDRRSWVCGYRIHGKQRRESLGDLRKVSLENARKAARSIFAKVELGHDPAAKKIEAKEKAARGTITFESKVPLYLEFKAGMVRPSTFAMLSYDLTRMCKPIARKAIEDIKLPDCAALINDIVRDAGKRSRTRHIQGEARAGRIMGERVRGHLSGFFKWALGEGFSTTNPIIGTNNPGAGIGSRTRVLSDAELSAVWHASGDGDAGSIIKLLILTGCRRNEISGLRWDEINMKRGTITLEGERTKNGQTLVLGLGEIGMGILREMHGKNPTFVFGDGSRPFVNWSYAINALHLRIAGGGDILKRWVLHDLRRTMRTGLTRLRVPPHIAERAINHVQPQIVEVYVPAVEYSYDDEIKVALLMWENFVRDRVIPLRGAPVIEGKQKLLAKV